MKHYIQFFIVLCVVSCGANLRNVSNDKTSIQRSRVQDTLPDKGFTNEQLVKDLGIIIDMYDLSTSNVVQIKKVNQKYEIKVMGKNYLGSTFDRNAPKLFEGSPQNEVFRKKVADAAKELGCVNLYKNDLFSFYATQGKTCK